MSNVKQVGPLEVYGPPCAFEPRWATLLVGEAPNKWIGGDPSRARHVLYRDDLADLCGGTLLDYYRCFARCNLLSYYPGRKGRGSAFPHGEARRVAEEAWPHLEASGFVRVVLVGRRVAKAFGPGPGSQPFFAWSTCTEPEIAVAPHPSKVSRWWNDEGNVRQAREFWADLMGEVLPQLVAERARRRATAS